MSDLTTIEQGFPALLDGIEADLVRAGGDLDALMQVRDDAKRAQLMAFAAGKTGIQVKASAFVAKAERAAVQANPPKTPEESGRTGGQTGGSGRGKGNEVAENRGVTAGNAPKPGTLRKWRNAYGDLTDAEFDAVVAAAEKAGRPVTQKDFKAVSDAKKKKKRLEAAAKRKAEREARQRSEGIDLRVRGIEDLINELDAESVHAIVTDPPYEESAIGLFGALGALAAKVLAPGGQLAVLSGKIFLPKVIAELEAVDGIQYRWVFSWRMDGGAFSRIMAANAIQAWKPVIIYRKPPKDKNREPFAKDTFDSEQLEPQREHHKWGQQTLATYRMLERFAWPGDTVLDPFLGGGTTAVCAKARGCNFIGADIDESCIITTQERIDKENPC